MKIKWKYNLIQLVHFGYQQAMSCIFPVAIFTILAISKVITIPYLHRYDFILIACVLVQILLYRAGIETKDDVKFSIRGTHYQMPLILSFFLIGFFIWIAENIATYFGAWQYPNQQSHWHLVHIGKISSWFLLVIISFIIVAQLKHIKKVIQGS